MAKFDHGGGCPCGLHKVCCCEDGELKPDVGTLQPDQRIWQIEYNTEPVEHMFDANGGETFDVTQAVEVVLKGARKRIIVPVKENDVFSFTLLADGING
jgi:hypothetical protein